MARSRKSVHAKLMLGAAVGALAMGFGVACAETTAITVAPQKLSSALHDFGSQTGHQIFFAPEIAAAKLSRGVDGVADEQLALQQILAGTGLTFRRDANAYIVEPEGGRPQSGSAAGGGAEVEALIVTAQKREEDIQDVPIAMSAFTQEQLERSQVAGGPDLMTQVPNMTFTKTNFSSYSIQLRGIGTQAISATTDAAVAVAFNNTPFIRNRFFEQEFYDLQRVEVLRGPQGTLYGRNATAGVVNIISQKPTFGYEARLSGDVSNYNSTRLEGMINVPLAEDIVALRIAGAWTKREGFVDNQITDNPIDGRDLWSTRLSLRFAPTDRLNANLIWEHFEEDDDRLRSGKQLCKRHLPTTIGGMPVNYNPGIFPPPGTGNGMLAATFFSQGCEAASLYSPDSFQAPNGLRLPYYRPLAGAALPIFDQNPDGSPFDPYASTTQSRDLRIIESTVDPHYSAETDTVELQVDFDLTDDLTLTSETGYLSDTLFSTQDYNRFNTRPGAFNVNASTGVLGVQTGVLSPEGVFCDPQIGCSDRVVAVDLSTADSHHFSQEFRVASDYEGNFNFSLGANFLRYDTEDKYYVFINTLSLYSALRSRGIWAIGAVPDYQVGVSDNHECLSRGYRPPDSNGTESITECVYIDPNPIGSLNDLGHNYFLSKNPYKLISYAVFGEAYYNLSDNLKLTTGLRWTVDKKEAPRIPSWILAAETVGYPIAEVIEQEWREPTGRITLDWQPDLGFTDETLLYGSYAHGYKAGGMNPPANGIVVYGNGATTLDLIIQQQLAVSPRTFAPEFIDAFEIGAKNTLLDGRLTLNGAAFYYDYEGYQISQIVNRAATNLNFDAKIWGIELEADWRPIENLRLGLKGGYEATRMADGSRAVDVMDRTAGRTDWYVTGPFPSLASNCVLPTYTVTQSDGELALLGYAAGGGLGPCEQAYVYALDPVTLKQYVANPPFDSGVIPDLWYEGYPGFDPLAGSPGHPYTGQNIYNGVDYGPAPNGGAGFYKDLSGNELPNAPHFTATITADYTLPLPSNWLMTLHSDLYYQSEAWTRIFNTEGYDKLKAYTNANLAAIFTNDEAGWKVMAYVKNVFDRDSITGAFLNSDDTGLTTNVFLTEPRLYGLRVTKEWNGGPWWTGANANHTGPYPLTVELGGQVQRHEADYERLDPALFAGFAADLNPTAPQGRDFDRGDGRELKLTYRPEGGWSVSAAMRYGRTNTDTGRTHAEVLGDRICALPYEGDLAKYANALCDPASPDYGPGWVKQGVTFMDASARSREEHTVVDFMVGKDVGLGLSDRITSTLGAGIRYAQMQSNTATTMVGIPEYYVPSPWWDKYFEFTRYRGSMEAEREFKGMGPTISWDAAARLLGNEERGHVDLDWSAKAGVLFGKQKTSVTGEALTRFYQANRHNYYTFPDEPVQVDLGEPSRSKSVTVPVLDLSLGLSYQIQRLKVGAGYRWERYFDVLDVGYQERKDADRTIDGPYFKLSVGFGG